jgi:hypothetical protein
MSHHPLLSKRPVSLTLAVILACGLGNLRAQSPKFESALSPTLMSKMLEVILHSGRDSSMAANIASALGITAAGEPWLDHEITVTATDGHKHQFAVSRGTDQDIVIACVYPDKILAYRVHRDGRVVAALAHDIKSKENTVRAPVETQAEAESEFKMWAEAPDKILHNEIPGVK